MARFRLRISTAAATKPLAASTGRRPPPPPAARGRRLSPLYSAMVAVAFLALTVVAVLSLWPSEPEGDDELVPTRPAVTSTATATLANTQIPTAMPTTVPPQVRVYKQLLSSADNVYTYRVYGVESSCTGRRSFRWSGVEGRDFGATVTLTVKSSEKATGSVRVTCFNGSATTNWAVQANDADAVTVTIKQDGASRQNADGWYDVNLIAETQGGGGCSPRICTYVWELLIGPGRFTGSGSQVTLAVPERARSTIEVTVTFPQDLLASDTASITAP